MRHVAIIQPGYLKLILAGRKRVEVRLSQNRVAPFGRVSSGDVIYFKARSGGFGARAVVAGVDEFEDLTPSMVASLFRRYNALVCGSAAFWRAKQPARFATFIHLSDARPTNHGPAYRDSPGFSPRSAWIVMKPPNSRRVRPATGRLLSLH